MRTTLTIDDDILAAAKSLAQDRTANVGQVLSELARRGLRAPSGRIRKRAGGFPVFAVPAEARPITPDDVAAAEDEP